MSSHALDNQMDERVFKELEDLKKQLRDLRTLQAQGADAVNMTITPWYEITYTLDHNSGILPYFYLSTDEGKPVFSVFEWDMCVGSWAEANLYKSAFNNFADTWDVHHHTSLGYSDEDYVEERFLIRNRSGSPKTIYLRGRWRYLVSNATGSGA